MTETGVVIEFQGWLPLDDDATNTTEKLYSLQQEIEKNPVEWVHRLLAHGASVRADLQKQGVREFQF